MFILSVDPQIMWTLSVMANILMAGPVNVVVVSHLGCGLSVSS